VAWELNEGLYGGALKQNMAWLCGLLPYEQAAQVMVRIGKRPVSASSLWRLAQKVGRALGNRTSHEQTMLEQPAETPPTGVGASVEPATRLLSMDGGMVNIEGEGWKELKVGLVGTVIADKSASGDEVPKVHTTAARYAAVLGDVATFTPVWLVYHGGWCCLDLALG
jgi:hypothetical protein